MIPLINGHRADLEALCQRYGVARLEVFGSAVEADSDAEVRDLDFLVVFQPMDQMGPADQYFGLLAALEELFDRPVDLVCARAIRNPYFARAVDESRTPVYAA